MRALRTVHALAGSPVLVSRHTNLTQKQGERRWVNVRFQLRGGGGGGERVCAQVVSRTVSPTTSPTVILHHELSKGTVP